MNCKNRITPPSSRRALCLRALLWAHAAAVAPQHVSFHFHMTEPNYNYDLMTGSTTRMATKQRKMTTLTASKGQARDRDEVVAKG